MEEAKGIHQHHMGRVDGKVMEKDMAKVTSSRKVAMVPGREKAKVEKMVKDGRTTQAKVAKVATREAAKETWLIRTATGVVKRAIYPEIAQTEAKVE
jgi:hypothetical protein